MANWEANLQQATIGSETQHDQATNLALEVFDTIGTNVTFVGYSLGGVLSNQQIIYGTAS